MTIKRKQEKWGQDHTQNAIRASYSDFKRQLVRMYYSTVKHAQNALKCEIMICIKNEIFSQPHPCFKQIVFAPVWSPDFATEPPQTPKPTGF